MYLAQTMAMTPNATEWPIRGQCTLGATAHRSGMEPGRPTACITKWVAVSGCEGPLPLGLDIATDAMNLGTSPPAPLPPAAALRTRFAIEGGQVRRTTVQVGLPRC